MLAGSFLALSRHTLREALDRRRRSRLNMYLVGLSQHSAEPRRPRWPLTGIFVVLSQLKINVTNAYAGSIAWSNFFSRLTHSHPGRVVWLVFNVAHRAAADGARRLQGARARPRPLFAVSPRPGSAPSSPISSINKPLGLSPPFIEFRRAHLYDINPVGVGAMLLATASRRRRRRRRF